MQMEIDNQAVLELAAEKVVEECRDIHETVSQLVSEMVRRQVAESIKKTVEKAITEEVEKALREMVTPVDVFGDKTGEPTTIRASIVEQSRNYWLAKVDRKGQRTSYGGEPRAEYLMKTIASDEFGKQVKEHLPEIITGIKSALKKNLTEHACSEIDRLFKR